MANYPHFKLAEFIKSDTAKKKGIDNTPDFEIVEHLSELCADFLEPLRCAFGMPIKISSGYRCPELNKAVNGAATSVHMKGYAADMQVGGSFNKFRDFTVKWVKDNKVKFDQLLIESDRRTGAKWLHVGLRNNAGEQRCQIKVMEK